MIRAVVIYKSKTGFTIKYAEWLAEELSADIYELSQVNIDMLTDYDTVIYGGSLHAAGIMGINFIMNNIEKLKGKKVVVFAVGASPSSEEVIKKLLIITFPGTRKNRLSFSTCGEASTTISCR